MCIATVPPSRKETVLFDYPTVKDSIRLRVRGHAGISLRLPPAIIELSDISGLVKIDHEAGPPPGACLPLCFSVLAELDQHHRLSRRIRQLKRQRD
jgi:hypothetical protein